MSKDIEEIKRELIKSLERDEIDFGAVGDLSDKLIHLDPTALRFSVDAKHIHRLGFELVGKQETALSELIKNAYDADATTVEIDFRDYDTQGGSLTISDNGNGMDETTIRNTWMRLSTNDKELNPVSPTYSRSRAGRKGIGRFAVERLGETLILETEVSGSDQGIKVIFDWDKYYKHGSSLTRVSNDLELYPKDTSSCGTKLTIKNLRDRWTEKQFERVWKSVLLLQPPFKVTKSHRGNVDQHLQSIDPGFNVTINGRSGIHVASELSIEESFLKHSLATIRGTLDACGKATYSVSSRTLELNDESSSDNEYLLIGKIDFELSYFIYESSLMSGISVRDARKLSESYGGVRIYRDGFRVMPYGEPHDDWLDLSYDSARRTLLVPANNYNFFGHIELNSNDNVLFEETSSREGLIENEAYEELQKFVRECIDWATKRIAASRGRKQNASQKGYESKPDKPSEKTKELIDKLEKESSGDSESVENETIEILEELNQKQKEYENFVDARDKAHAMYEEMLRILASLGLSISMFGHEVRGSLTRVRNSITQLKGKILTNKHDDDITTLINETESSVDNLFDLAAYIVDLLSHSKSREKQQIPLYASINNFIKQFSDYLDARNIKFVIDIKPLHLRTTDMHPSEIDSVLFNFLTNSVKSMERANISDRMIKISAAPENEYSVISFQDNGEGIKDEIKSRVFDAFFTTSHTDADTVAGPGSGLGLRIVSDIASANGGFVRIGTPESGYRCNFEFAVPLAQKSKV